MATQSALQRRVEKLRRGVKTKRAQNENLARGDMVYSGGTNNPNSGGTYTPYYDAEYDLAESDVLRRQARTRSEGGLALDRLKAASRDDRRDMDKLRHDALRMNTTAMADQGILRSGINIGQQGEIGSDYLTALRDLSEQTRQGQEDIERGIAQEEADLSNELQLHQLMRGQREAEARLEQAMREAELAADQEALAATQRELEQVKENNKPKANGAGKYIPPGYKYKVGKGTSRKHLQNVKNKKFTPKQLKARKKRRLAAKNKKKKK